MNDEKKLKDIYRKKYEYNIMIYIGDFIRYFDMILDIDFKIFLIMIIK